MQNQDLIYRKQYMQQLQSLKDLNIMTEPIISSNE